MLKYSKQNFLFTKFLLENLLISGYTTELQHKRKFIVLFIKYTHAGIPAITDYSITSKTTAPKAKQKMPHSKEQVNFIVDYKATKGNYSRLLARFR